MKKKITFLFLLALVFPMTTQADVGRLFKPLPCGIYDQQSRPFIEADLETQSTDPHRYTMEITTTNGKRLSVEIQNVSIKMEGERSHVSVFVDGKPYAKTSHQDLPLYLEVHLDKVKYRIICTRPDSGDRESGAADNRVAAAPPDGKE